MEKIIVWGEFSLNDPNDIYAFRRDTLIAERYQIKILASYITQYGIISDIFILMNNLTDLVLATDISRIKI